MKKLTEIINLVLSNRGKKTFAEIKRTDLLIVDLGLDSLDLAELTVRIEAHYDIDIFENGIVSTFGEICDTVGVYE